MQSIGPCFVSSITILVSAGTLWPLLSARDSDGLNYYPHLVPNSQHLGVILGQVLHVVHIQAVPELLVRHTVQDVAGVLHGAGTRVTPPQLTAVAGITAKIHFDDG